jgi:hypothetical protein
MHTLPRLPPQEWVSSSPPVLYSSYIMPRNLHAVQERARARYTFYLLLVQGKSEAMTSWTLQVAMLPWATALCYIAPSLTLLIPSSPQVWRQSVQVDEHHLCPGMPLNLVFFPPPLLAIRMHYTIAFYKLMCWQLRQISRWSSNDVASVCRVEGPSSFQPPVVRGM